MLAYTIYSEAGGVGKTTLAASLATAHADHGRDVLAIDLDPQQGSLTYLLGVDAPRGDGDADNIGRHLIDRPLGEFDDLVHETGYGFDLVPNHDMLENLPSLLSRAEEMAEDLGEYFSPNERLLEVLAEAGVMDDYDTLIIDPPATAGPHLYNAIHATRSLVVPVEPTGKGIQSVEGLEDVVLNLSDSLDIDVGVLAVIPNGIGSTSDQAKYLERIRDLGFDAPVAIADRSSLFEGCWDQQYPASHYVKQVRSAYDYEEETLAQLEDLATHVEEVA
ncbi:ParA family protein [Haloarcula onubensis]|uniref:ParA family protein n=1 Tax=Haloarcula onubensis TaxID=2950539 RepID=A0ABU2FUH4_9EURY|nr:ParA family protein [Halomicroarcula sp. S3CR25-11]MDS0284424.1 ParA family protein [Halomicroarcula sp. S3CR25-11]